MPIGLMVVCYLFLGGTGAGALFFMALMQLKSPSAYRSGANPRRFAPQRSLRSFFVHGYCAALAVLAIAALFLLFDLGRMDRALALFLVPTFSFLTFGSYALALALLCAAALALAWSSRGGKFSTAAANAFAVVSVAAASGVMAYTGFLLFSLGPAIAAWSSPLVPVLFILSALSTGIALIIGVCAATDDARRHKGVICNLVRIDVAVAAAELLAAILFAATANSSAAFAGTVFDAPEANIAFGLFVIAGLLIPLALDLVELRRGALRTSLASSASILTGSFCLRFAIVSAGAWAASAAVSSVAPLVVL